MLLSGVKKVLIIASLTVSEIHLNICHFELSFTEEISCVEKLLKVKAQNTKHLLKLLKLDETISHVFKKALQF